MKFIFLENIAPIVDKIKKGQYHQLSQKEKDMIDQHYHEWLKAQKLKRDTPQEFLDFLKSLNLGM